MAVLIGIVFFVSFVLLIAIVSKGILSLYNIHNVVQVVLYSATCSSGMPCAICHIRSPSRGLAASRIVRTY